VAWQTDVMSSRPSGGSSAGGGAAGPDVRKALAYLAIGVWSSSVIVAGLLFYLLGPRRHHVELGAIVAAIYLIGTGAVNVFYLRRMKRQWAERLPSGGSGLGPSGRSR
jgi:hypothetical protein